MSTITTRPAQAASPETLDLVRHHVRALLSQSPAFQSLEADRQREIANQTVQIASYLAEPDGIRADRLPPPADPYALAQAGETGTSSRRRGGPETPQFRAQAAREGAAAAGLYLQQVNFPEFVGGLINKVFHAIVTSSIQQMEAYGKLVADVSKTLNQFRDENVSVNQGRDYLVDTYPDIFTLDLDTGDEGTGPRVRVREDVDEEQALSRVSALPVEGGPIDSLDDEVVEEKLVPAARTQLATSRQQLLATLVLMGINRIVVSDGKIQAKVIFDFQARDNFRFQNSATYFDYHPTATRQTRTGEFESDYQGSEYNRSKEGEVESRGASYYSKGNYTWTSDPVLTLASASQLQTDAALSTKAQLTGNVEVNFKSDYLPLERMADSFQIAQIQQAAQPNRGAGQPAGTRGTPAPQTPVGQPAPVA